MDWIHFEISGKSLLSPIEQPYFLNQQQPPPPPPPYPTSLQSSGFNLNNKVSPSILLIIIILAIIFFVSGLLHLLVRYLMRPPNRDPDDLDSVTALQGQLQQLFHLHDAGVDQSYIDTLPVFSYKAIIGVKMDPFDCAVCLCEFEGEDKLRLLPKCSHAFHMECIDTWLLSHSTCPLCRASLLPDFSANHHGCSPIVFVLESGSNDSSREIISDREAISGGDGGGALAARVGSHLSSHRGDDEFGVRLSDLLSKSREIQPKEIENTKGGEDSGEKVVQVKLGKFKNLDCVGEGSSNDNNDSSNIDSRRCFSMGSFAYVMDENTSLHVPIRATPLKTQSSKKPCLPLTPGHRPAMSECGGCDSRRYYFNGDEGGGGFEALKILELQNGGNGNGNGSICTYGNDNNKAIQCCRKESFSVSKIWLRGKKDRRPNSAKVDSSRRAFSFRFPLQQNVLPADEQKSKNGNGGGAAAARRTVSEICVGSWENGGSEWGGWDEEVQSCNSLDSQPNAPSFARRTLLWLMGRPNKVVHSTFSSNV